MWEEGTGGQQCPMGSGHLAGALQGAQHPPPPAQGPPGQPGYPGATGPPGLPVSTVGSQAARASPQPPRVSAHPSLVLAGALLAARAPAGTEHCVPAGLIPVPPILSHTFPVPSPLPVWSCHLCPIHPRTPSVPICPPTSHPCPMSQLIPCPAPSSPSFPRASKASEAMWAPPGRKGNW